MTTFGAGVHPDIPPYLVHFTGRPRADTDPPPAGISPTPEGRLAGIGLTGALIAKPVFGTTGPVVCFSECSPAAMSTLFSTGVTWRGRWDPWAVVFDRDRLIAAGARPVLLLDDGEWTATEAMPMPMRDRRQRYVPGKVDFTAEREWRLSMWAPDWDGRLWPLWWIAPAAVGIVVGVRGWLPAPDWVTSYGQEPPQLRFAAAFNGLQRWWWNGTTLVADGWCDINSQIAQIPGGQQTSG